MRVASYNLWNTPEGWDQRLPAIADELRALAADVIALQEAPTEAAPGRPFAAYLAAETGYRRVLHLPYPPARDDSADSDDDRPEGLAIVSQHPMQLMATSWALGLPARNAAATVHVAIDGAIVGVTNLHLDGRDPASRPAAVVEILERLVDPPAADLDLLCGDFNEHDDGPVADYLERCDRPWRDTVVASVGRAAAPITLDAATNPRWAGTAATEPSGRFDRIYVRSPRGGRKPHIRASRLFGRDPANRAGIIPSDHYGVLVDLEL